MIAGERKEKYGKQNGGQKKDGGWKTRWQIRKTRWQIQNKKMAGEETKTRWRIKTRWQIKKTWGYIKNKKADKKQDGG